MVVRNAWPTDTDVDFLTIEWHTHAHKFYNLLRLSLGVTSLQKGTVASKDLSSMAPQAVLAFVWVPWRWK